MAKAKKPDRPATVTTGLHLPEETFRLLRRAAFARAERDGGRPSVSALVVELAEDARDRLEAEAEGAPKPSKRRR